MVSLLAPFGGTRRRYPLSAPMPKLLFWGAGGSGFTKEGPGNSRIMQNMTRVYNFENI